VLDLVAGAIADPVRREILLMLRAGPMPAGEIAGRFTITRPAVSRHLRVLRESGLVRDETVGRQRMYALDTAGLTALADWITQVTAPASAWESRLDAFETEVYRTRRDHRRTTNEGHPDRQTGSHG
jgi:DNA-binding transcriptional ArsR family regulator